MSKPNIKKLNKLAFVKMIPARNAKIAAADAKMVPPPEAHKANQLALALHPARQYLKVAAVETLGKDVKCYTLVPYADKGTRSLAYFSAGQYLSFSLTVGQAKITRPYSIASAPAEALQGRYRIAVKRTEGGLASNYILDHWTVGTEVETSGPEGVFTYEPLRDAAQIVGLAGGCGITPFLSLAHAIADGAEDAALTLLYGCKKTADVLFMEEFEAIAAVCPKFKLVKVLSDDETASCERGFITAELIKKYAPQGEYSLFICGPQAMYHFLDKEIPKLGLRNKFVRREVFGEYRNPEKDKKYPKQAGDAFKLTVLARGEKFAMDCSAHDTLLATIEKNGIAAPARCRSGECGWCHSRLAAGEVYIPKSVDGRRLADFDYGWVHPCCTFPLSDVTLEIYPE